ncbi:MAG: electron transport complex subunit RsxC [Clostridia bacterium]|jgi:electron transport complex protein RnfC|nr:electron transport complex subunit RsxC [Clostridia bacterium]MDD4146026.1 electron transport complex subunit RsxC [Clostridia bacterium]MDD4665609.1 electron transport complex subunit RsxC [Clostridia bacterium]
MNTSTFKGGLHLPGYKEGTQGLSIVPASIPDKVYLPVSQHLGAPCIPLVEIGAEVKKGQKIAAGKGFVTAPIHASVSGQVVAIEKKQHPGGNFVDCLVIVNNRKEEWADTVKPNLHPGDLTAEEIRRIIFEAGIVGLGGATFPAHVKYAPVEGKKVEYIILNGVECEPYITADHRLMLEKAERIVAGLRYILKSTGCQQGIIAIEENKPDAIALLKKVVASDKHIRVQAFQEKYPQGSEKHLIYACTQREVPIGRLPLDVGVIVNNVGTAVAIADAVELGIPLIERVVTLSGDGIKKPANYLVRLGTLFSYLIAKSGGYTGEIEKIIAGGLMMGKAVFTPDIPVIKGSSGIVVLKKVIQKKIREYNCVRCGKCMEVCPLFLEPTTIVKLAKRGLWEEAAQNNALSCIECGSCAYVCPARIPLVQYLRRAKQAISVTRAKVKNVGGEK